MRLLLVCLLCGFLVACRSVGPAEFFCQTPFGVAHIASDDPEAKVSKSDITFKSEGKLVTVPRSSCISVREEQ